MINNDSRLCLSWVSNATQTQSAPYQLCISPSAIYNNTIVPAGKLFSYLYTRGRSTVETAAGPVSTVLNTTMTSVPKSLTNGILKGARIVSESPRAVTTVVSALCFGGALFCAKQAFDNMGRPATYTSRGTGRAQRYTTKPQLWKAACWFGAASFCAWAGYQQLV